MKIPHWLKTRLGSYPMWIALFAIIALTGQVFGIYQVPEGWDKWVNGIMAFLIAAGVVTNPLTSGYKDGDK